MSNYNDMKLLIATYSGNERHITIPKIYLELTNDYPTAALLNQMIFWSDKTKRRDGFFYKTYKEWEEETFLSEYQVRRASKVLKELGFLETKLKKANGSPTLHYKLDMVVLSESIVKKLKNRNQRNSSNDNEVYEESLTVDDTVNDNSRKDSPAKAEPSIPYKKIIGYLNEKADRKFSHVAKSNKDLIKARWNGLKKLDSKANDNELYQAFVTVIDNKVADANDPNHFFKEEYLQPSTLFRESNFDKYLNQPSRQKTQVTKPQGNNYIDDWSVFENMWSD